MKSDLKLGNIKNFNYLCHKKSTFKHNIIMKNNIEQSVVNQFCQALNSGALFCVIHSVSKSGMSRSLAFYSPVTNKDGSIYYRNYHSLMLSLGYKRHRSNDGFVINGCGMDMVFNTIYCMIGNFDSMGMIDKDVYNVESLKQSRVTRF